MAIGLDKWMENVGVDQAAGEVLTQACLQKWCAVPHGVQVLEQLDVYGHALIGRRIQGPLIAGVSKQLGGEMLLGQGGESQPGKIESGLRKSFGVWEALSKACEQSKEIVWMEHGSVAYCAITCLRAVSCFEVG